MMNIGQLKKWLEANNVPDNMPFILIDSTTDNTDDMNYFISEDELSIEDIYNPEDEGTDNYGIPVGKAVMLYFKNKLNENPI